MGEPLTWTALRLAFGAELPGGQDEEMACPLSAQDWWDDGMLLIQYQAIDAEGESHMGTFTYDPATSQVDGLTKAQDGQ